MSWQESLVRLADYEVEQLRKRLADVLDRKASAEDQLMRLLQEAEIELRRFAEDASLGWSRQGYLNGWRARRDGVLVEIEGLAIEEAGARDALAQAFEELKKYEQISEMALEGARKEEARRETAEMDELGSRRVPVR